MMSVHLEDSPALLCIIVTQGNVCACLGVSVDVSFLLLSFKTQVGACLARIKSIMAWWCPENPRMLSRAVLLCFSSRVVIIEGSQPVTNRVSAG
jgi:hypothetical protein